MALANISDRSLIGHWSVVSCQLSLVISPQSIVHSYQYILGSPPSPSSPLPRVGELVEPHLPHLSHLPPLPSPYFW
jgi:hypothetical protein